LLIASGFGGLITDSDDINGAKIAVGVYVCLVTGSFSWLSRMFFAVAEVHEGYPGVVAWSSLVAAIVIGLFELFNAVYRLVKYLLFLI